MKPPDEPAVLGTALNEEFVPLLQKQFPEIVDFYLPPEGCSYRMAVISMKPASNQKGARFKCTLMETVGVVRRAFESALPSGLVIAFTSAF